MSQPHPPALWTQERTFTPDAQMPATATPSYLEGQAGQGKGPPPATLVPARGHCAPRLCGLVWDILMMRDVLENVHGQQPRWHSKESVPALNSSSQRRAERNLLPGSY